MTLRCIDAGKVPYFRSQSLYHGLGYSMEENSPDTIVFATPANPYICIGNFQDPNLEIDRQFCEERNLPLIRRQTGGGAVYIDKNQLFIQWIFKTKSLPARVNERFKLFMEPLIQTHQFFGIDAYFHPVNDVHVDGKKIVGTGAATIGNAEVITGNFLFDFDYETMAGALKLPNQALRSKVHESLCQYVTTIQKEGEITHPDEWKKVYLKKCEEILSCTIQFGSMTENELKSVKRWDEKLVSTKWLEANHRNPGEVKLIKIQAAYWIGIVKLEFHSGTGFIQIGLKDNTVSFMQLEGIPMNGSEKVIQALTGVEIDSEKITDRLNPLRNEWTEDQLMKPDEWTALILKVGKEKNKLAGHG